MRDQLKEPIDAQAVAEAMASRTRDEALATLREKETPRIREAAIAEFREKELPALLASSSGFNEADFALGQVEYHSWVLHYFGEIIDDVQVRSRDRIWDGISTVISREASPMPR